MLHTPARCRSRCRSGVLRRFRPAPYPDPSMLKKSEPAPGQGASVRTRPRGLNERAGWRARRGPSSASGCERQVLRCVFEAAAGGFHPALQSDATNAKACGQERWRTGERYASETLLSAVFCFFVLFSFNTFRAGKPFQNQRVAIRKCE